MSAFRSSEDYRLLWGTDAPEVDHARCAPGNRTDNTAPEVDPGRDAQVYYNTSPPEVFASNSAEPNGRPSTTEDILETESRNKAAIITVVGTVIVAVSLGTGLGVGLRSRMDDASQASSTSALSGSGASNSSVPSSISVPRPLPSNFALPHALMDNTPISAVT
ncbi:MAG: hypothetical protein Q9215_005210 [Flavoplaca cf. flavocitrina]